MFHINRETGEAGPCKAKTEGGCPFGSAAEHYGDINEARAAFESEMSEENLKVHKKLYKPRRLPTAPIVGKSINSYQTQKDFLEADLKYNNAVNTMADDLAVHDHTPESVQKLKDDRDKLERILKNQEEIIGRERRIEAFNNDVEKLREPPTRPEYEPVWSEKEIRERQSEVFKRSGIYQDFKDVDREYNLAINTMNDDTVIHNHTAESIQKLKENRDELEKIVKEYMVEDSSTNEKARDNDSVIFKEPSSSRRIPTSPIAKTPVNKNQLEKSFEEADRQYRRTQDYMNDDLAVYPKNYGEEVQALKNKRDMLAGQLGYTTIDEENRANAIFERKELSKQISEVRNNVTDKSVGEGTARYTLNNLEQSLISRYKDIEPVTDAEKKDFLTARLSTDQYSVDKNTDDLRKHGPVRIFSGRKKRSMHATILRRIQISKERLQETEEALKDFEKKTA